MSRSVHVLLEPEVLVLRVRLGVLLERLVLDEHVVGREHHERPGRLVLELLRAVPLLPHPLLVQEQLVVLVRDARRRERPRALEPGTVPVAAPESVRAAQRDDLLVVEAHAVEDLRGTPGVSVRARCQSETQRLHYECGQRPWKRRADDRREGDDEGRRQSERESGGGREALYPQGLRFTLRPRDFPVILSA